MTTTSPARFAHISPRHVPSTAALEIHVPQHTNVTQMDVIILVGGKGTRLRRVVGDKPKPLAKVAGRPFVEWLLLALRSQGLRRVILATGYKGEMIEAHFGNGAQLGVELVYSHETLPLGTAGAAGHAARHLMHQRVLLLNGDSLCPFNVNRLVEVHAQTAARATLSLVPVGDCRRYGSVHITRDGRVIAFREKSPQLGSGLINAGVYLFDREVLAGLPPDRSVSLETEVFPSLLAHGLHASVGQGPFLDIGTPASYSIAESFFSENKWPWHAVL